MPKSALKNGKSAKPVAKVQIEAKPEEKPEIVKPISSDANVSKPNRVQFRIMVGSYEHNLMCLSVILGGSSDAVFQRIFHFQAHALSIKSIDIAKRYLVTGSNDEHIKIYDLQKRKELGDLMGHQGTITALKFSDEGHAANEDVQESTDKSGKWLLSGSEDGKIIIWRTKDWEMFGTLKGHQGKINDVAIHPTGRVAISVSQDQTIRLWNLMTSKKAAVLKIKGRDHLGEYGEFVRWSLDGKYFFVGLLNSVLVYDSTSAKIVMKLKVTSTLMSLEVIRLDDKEFIVTGLGNGTIQFYEFESQIKTSISDRDEATVWDSKPETFTPIFELRGHTNRIKDLSYFNHPTETNGVPYLISVASDGKIVVWDLSSNVRDQVAVYDTGERLNCVVTCPETVEKVGTMKRRFTSLEEMNGEDVGGVSESEYETDGEEIKKIMMPKKKKGKKGKKQNKVEITLE